MFSSKFLHSYISIYLQAGLRQQITKWFYNHTHSIKKSCSERFQKYTIPAILELAGETSKSAGTELGKIYTVSCKHIIFNDSQSFLTCTIIQNS